MRRRVGRRDETRGNALGRISRAVDRAVADARSAMHLRQAFPLPPSSDNGRHHTRGHHTRETFWHGRHARAYSMRGHHTRETRVLTMGARSVLVRSAHPRWRVGLRQVLVEPPWQTHLSGSMAPGLTARHAMQDSTLSPIRACRREGCQALLCPLEPRPRYGYTSGTRMMSCGVICAMPRSRPGQRPGPLAPGRNSGP